MPPIVALCFCVLFVFWLFARDLRNRQEVSGALWIPLCWALIISSRPLSLWLGSGGDLESTGYVQDKLVDKALFVFLIAAGLCVLLRRRANWRSIVRLNKWVFVYFLYLGISVLWSDDPFVSFKRWIKDFGNIVMVLVVLSEREPGQAVRAFLARSSYLVIPMSVLVLKYYPQISRHYDIWTSRPAFVGMSTDKNTFGMSLFVCGLALFWILLETFRGKGRRNDNAALFSCSILLLATAWLLQKAHSATALSCMVLGCCILLGLKVPAIRRQVKWLGAYTAALGLLILLFQTSGLWNLILAQVTGIVGRDASLHGRADIWRVVLKEDINPLLGVGFYSFWSPERNQRLSEDYYYSLGTAHNGYVETYLNSGLIGVLLLALVLVSAGKTIKRDVLNGSDLSPLRLAFLISVVIYNITESAYDRLVPVWFALLLVIIEYPRLQKRESNVNLGHGTGFRIPAGPELVGDRSG